MIGWAQIIKDRYARSLLDSKSLDEDVVDNQVKMILLELRWKRACAPWVKLVGDLTISIRRFARLGWKILNGQYRRTAAQVHGSPAQPSGGGAGATSIPTTHVFTGYGGGFSTTGPVTTISSSGTFEDAGVRAGEVVAYRCWWLKEGLLYSIYQDEFVWEPKKPAQGKPDHHGEGIHGFKDRLSACQYVGLYEGFIYSTDGARGPIVSGTIEMWGEVYEHARGYRSSYAAVASIDDSPNYDAAVLRKKYGLNRRKKKKVEKE